LKTLLQTAFERNRVEEENDGKETLTGYCSLSENLEPCEWTFSKPKDMKQKPLMRILF